MKEKNIHNAPLVDNHGRPINYVRLAVTDRCNLRCFYCMPAEGMKFLPRKALLTYEEMEKLLTILASLGVNKVRITGGEPFVRKDLMSFLERVNNIDGIDNIHITTNGILTLPHVSALKRMGISGINLSLDTIDRERFKLLTRRDELDAVMDTFHALIANDITTKINAVIVEGKNTDDIIPLAALSKKYPVSIRYIEEMPFNGTGANYKHLTWNHAKIYQKLKEAYPDLTALPTPKNSTSTNYQIPGHKGNLGIIAAYSRTFCGSCNRIRLTSQGVLQTCLYGGGGLDFRHMLRTGASDEAIKLAFMSAIDKRPKDGFEAEKLRASRPVSESMSTIGG